MLIQTTQATPVRAYTAQIKVVEAKDRSYFTSYFFTITVTSSMIPQPTEPDSSQDSGTDEAVKNYTSIYTGNSKTATGYIEARIV